MWAHNAHVQRRPGWMGRFLEERFPGQVVVLGFATGQGTYMAVSDERALASHSLAPPPPGSFEQVFLATGLPRFVLDLRRAVPGSTGSGFVFEERRFRSIGAVAADEQFHPLRLRESFDAVVWIEKTTAAVPLAP